MKSFLKRSFIYVIALFVLSFLVACGNSSTDTSSNNDDENNANETTNEANDDGNSNDGDSTGEVIELNIGYTGPLSGPAAFYGEATIDGLKLAADEINEAGGFVVDGKTYKINIVSYDDGYLPDQAATNAKRLVQEHDVSVIFIPHSGGILASQVFNEQDGFLIAAFSSEPAITEGGNPLTVAVVPKYVDYIPTLTNYTFERFGKKLAVLPTATQYGKDWTGYVVPYWEGLGGEVVYDSAIDFSSETDFFTIVSNALATNPDVMFVGGPSYPVAELIRQTRELGFEGGFMIMDQAKLDEMMEVLGGYEALEGAVGVMPIRHNGHPATPGFIEKFQAWKGSEIIPNPEQGFNYMGLYAIVEAMKIANTVDDPVAIRENIEAGLLAVPEEIMIYDIPGVYDDGVFKVEIMVGAIENGDIVHVDVIKE